jgi:16S rRNA (uracil1498-N3)-methyltransferase
MTRRRFYAPPSAFTSNCDSVILATDEARHLRDVLRLKPDDEVHVFDGKGKEFQCVIEESARGTVRLKVIAEVAPASSESPLRLTLAVALLKGEKFDLVVQKTTELGVTRIVPVITKFGDIRLRNNSDATKRVARWQRISLEAAKQSGRAFVPEVVIPVAVETLIQTEIADELINRVMFSERDGQSISEVKKVLPEGLSSLTVLVGPEGGWADEEIALARKAGWSIVTMQGRTLRAETAAISVTVLLQHLFGDLG